MPHRMIEDLPRHLFHLLLGAQETILEARLPKATLDAVPPGSSESQVLELRDEPDNVTGQRWAEDQVHVLRHHAIGVDQNLCLVSVPPQHVDDGGRDGGIGEDGAPVLDSYRNRTDRARLPKGLGTRPARRSAVPPLLIAKQP